MRANKKTIEKVRKLIALSGSDNQTEARNAAYQACKLIREHELLVGYSSGERSRASGVTPDVVSQVVNQGAQAVSDWFNVTPKSDMWFGKNRYSGKTCAACANTIHRGEEIVVYKRTKNAYHKRCNTSESE